MIKIKLLNKLSRNRWSETPWYSYKVKICFPLQGWPKMSEAVAENILYPSARPPTMDNGLYDVTSNSTLTVFDIACNSTNCTESTEAPPYYGRDENFAKVEIIVQAIILFLAVFGNGVVLFIFLTRRKKLSRMNLMIVHLSIADLFVAFFNILPQLIWDITYRFYGNDFLCRSVKLGQVMAMYASSYVLVSTAIDRYLAICHPLTAQTWTSRKTHILVGVAWLLSLLFSLPQLHIFAYREVTPGAGVYDCWAVFNPDWTASLYVTWVTLAIYIVPFIILAGCYGRICYVVWKSMMAREPSIRERKRYSWRRMGSQKNGTYKMASTKIYNNANGERNGATVPRAHVRTMSKAKVKTVKLTLVVIATYLVCWGPFFISQMWSVWDPNAPFTGLYHFLYTLLIHWGREKWPLFSGRHFRIHFL